MVSSAVNKVLHNEKNAQDKIIKARIDAEKIISDAKTDAQNLYDKIINNAHLTANKEISEAKEQAKNITDNAKDDALILKKEIIKANSGKENQALKIVQSIIL